MAVRMPACETGSSTAVDTTRPRLRASCALALAGSVDGAQKQARRPPSRPTHRRRVAVASASSRVGTVRHEGADHCCPPLLGGHVQGRPAPLVDAVGVGARRQQRLGGGGVPGVGRLRRAGRAGTVSGREWRGAGRAARSGRRRAQAGRAAAGLPDLARRPPFQPKCPASLPPHPRSPLPAQMHTPYHVQRGPAFAVGLVRLRAARQQPLHRRRVTLERRLEQVPHLARSSPSLLWLVLSASTPPQLPAGVQAQVRSVGTGRRPRLSRKTCKNCTSDPLRCAHL